MTRLRTFGALAALSLASAPLHAAPFAPFDVRAAGMGGTGVASAKTASASLFNPAMLSMQHADDNFQFVLGAGAGATDESEMLDTVDTMQSGIDAFNAASTDLEIYQSAVTIRDSLVDINGNSLVGDVGLGLGFGKASTDLGIGVFATTNAQIVVMPTVAAADLTYLNGVIADYESDSDIDVPPGTFPANSTVTGVVMAVAEYGASFSHQYALSAGSLAIGVTPKVVNVRTLDYTSTVDTFDEGDINSGQYETTDSGFDLDAGVMYKPAADSLWQFGLVAKNLVGGDYKTVAGRDLSINTQLRAGAARTTKQTTLAVDLDLTKNDGIGASAETQFASLGAEYDLKYLQLRAGYRANLASSDVDDVLTAGIGLGPVDLSAQLSGDTLGAFLQIGFGW